MTNLWQDTRTCFKDIVPSMPVMLMSIITKDRLLRKSCYTLATEESDARLWWQTD